MGFSLLGRPAAVSADFLGYPCLSFGKDEKKKKKKQFSKSGSAEMRTPFAFYFINVG